MTIKEVCLQLGIPLALDKVEGSSKSLTFLGIVINTGRMELEACLPEEKLARICYQLAMELWQGKEGNLKTDFVLGWCTPTCHQSSMTSRTFVSRMYNGAAKLRELSH